MLLPISQCYTLGVTKIFYLLSRTMPIYGFHITYLHYDKNYARHIAQLCIIHKLVRFICICFKNLQFVQFFSRLL